jgi:hypothetical protein
MAVAVQKQIFNTTFYFQQIHSCLFHRCDQGPVSLSYVYPLISIEATVLTETHHFHDLSSCHVMTALKNGLSVDPESPK